MKPHVLDIDTIATDLADVRDHFEDINSRLKIRRDSFDNTIMNNMLELYEYVNYLLSNQIDVFGHGGDKYLLEMNHIALMGTDPSVRTESHKHIMETRKKFRRHCNPIFEWVDKKSNKGVYKVAAGIFVQGVSQPQLFIEGNHRTHSTMVNYLLLQHKKSPFILNKENAVAFFDPAQEIKGTLKGSLSSSLKLLKHKKHFKEFFSHYASDRYVKK